MAKIIHKKFRYLTENAGSRVYCRMLVIHSPVYMSCVLFLVLVFWFDLYQKIDNFISCLEYLLRMKICYIWIPWCVWLLQPNRTLVKYVFVLFNRASKIPRSKSGALVQMKLIYSPLAPFLLFLLQWMDCTCTCLHSRYINLFHILIYKVALFFIKLFNSDSIS